MRIEIGLIGALMLAACGQNEATTSEAPSAPVQSEAEAIGDAAQPNFLIVVADDLGWSDVGAFGGEINTPTLDALADRGLMMTSFYVAPTCSPTRSMLFTGMDSHPAGIGAMAGIQAPNQTTRNYAGELHDQVVTFSEALHNLGYETMMSGKWHLALSEAQHPNNRGFDKSFTLLQGGASHFADQQSINPIEIPEYFENGERIEELPEDFYSSIDFTDKMLEYLQQRDGDKPFLAYLAYTAPHDPLQVPDDWLDRYDGAYDAGPLAIRSAREDRLKEKGVIDEDAALWQMPNFPAWLPMHAAPWETRTEDQRNTDSRPMEIYASMVELMDQQLGRVIAELEASGDLENTYVIFFSDNGASAIGPLVYPGNTKEWFNANWDRQPENAGKPGNFTVMGREWANTSNTPWRMFKSSVGDGGIRSPMIVAGPTIAQGDKTDALAHVMDIAPSLYELTGVDPANDALFEGMLPVQGVSLLPVWRQAADEVRDSFATELFGARAVRRGDWKATLMPIPAGSGQWELYDLSNDPGEAANVAGENPDVLASLIAEYDSYAELNGVIPPNPQPSQSLRNLYPHLCDDECEASFERFAEMLKNGPPPGANPANEQ
ncbi:MAG: arylsulfatase [Pseudomonadota bacterium]